MPRLARTPDTETTPRLWLTHASFCLLEGWPDRALTEADITLLRVFLQCEARRPLSSTQGFYRRKRGEKWVVLLAVASDGTEPRRQISGKRLGARVAYEVSAGPFSGPAEVVRSRTV